jgi:magnesium transporter
LQATVHSLKRELRMLRRAVWPLRELTASLSRDDIDFVDETVRVAFRDCYDHAMMAADFLESSRERIADIGDRYLAVVAERTNQTMKVLTIIATIFIPLTYLAGIYGMNFDTTASNLNMPELGWRYGYITFWGVSFAVAFTMLGMFWKKGWLSR